MDLFNRLDGRDRIEWLKKCYNEQINRPNSGGGSSPLYTWYAPLQTPTQPDIARDGTEYYWPLDDATPNVSVVNYAGAKTLTKAGAGTISAVTDFFNESGKGVLFDGSANLTAAGIMDADLGTQDFYVEFYATADYTGAIYTIFVGDTTNGWSVRYDNRDIVLTLYSGGVTKSLTKRITVELYIADATRHHIKIEVDRDNAANRKIYMDGVALADFSDTISDYSATSITGTSLTLGSTHIGELSQVKIVYGAYTGSTTPAFDKGLTVDTGTGAITYTRASYATGRNAAYNNKATYTNRQVTDNTVIYRPDPTLTASGILLESTSTNLVKYSRNIGDATWVASNVTKTSYNISGIFGARPRASKLVSTAGPNNASVIQNTGTAATASVKYVMSAWIKGNAGGENIQLRLGDVAGTNTAALLDVTTGAAGTVTTDWKRFYVVHTMQAAPGNVESAILMNSNTQTIWGDAVLVEKAYPYTNSAPSSFIHTFNTTVTRAATTFSIPNTELSTTKFTWLAMISPTWKSTEKYWTCSGGSVDSDLGDTTMTYGGGVWSFQYFGTWHGDTIAQTWNPFDWFLIGMSINTTDDQYAQIINATLGTYGTTAKATPTYSTPLYIANNIAGTVPMGVAVGEVRIYKDRNLTQAEITAQYAEMKTAMGLP